MSNLPSYLQKYQAPDLGAALAANLGSAMPPHVSIKDNRFTLVDASNNEIPVPTFDPKIGVYLDAAIIDVNNVMSRIYFGQQYDGGAEGVRPDCFSDNGIGPSMSASSPQAPTCAACPRSEWTKINANGNKVPWCTQKQKIALLIPGMPTLFLLAVPPNSHGPMREYVNHCKGTGVNIADLITRISFVSQGTLQFQPLSYIDEPAAVLRQAAYAEKKTDDLVGRNDVARPAGAIAAPVQQPVQQIAPPGQPPQQAQQPVFQQAAPAQTSLFAPNAAGTGPTPATTAPAAATASPSEPAQGGRRRRRTAAEMQAANGPAPGTGQPAPAAGQTAPFPHPGQAAQPANGAFPQSTQPSALPGQTDMGFGMAQGQPASANPELSGMLDSFFKQG